MWAAGHHVLPIFFILYLTKKNYHNLYQHLFSKNIEFRSVGYNKTCFINTMSTNNIITFIKKNANLFFKNIWYFKIMLLHHLLFSLSCTQCLSLKAAP